MANIDETKTLGTVIRDARVKGGRTLREFAKLLDITPSYQSDIENDRRVPAEEVLKKTADLLALSFEELMARAGRIGEDAERYLRRHPAAGALFRRLTEANAPDAVLRKMIEEAEEFKRKKEGGE
jgi:transcriptional regulator with XRE-family HTH domain